MNFLKTLQTKLGQHDPDDVDQLIIDDLFEEVGTITDEMREGLEKYKDLKHLSMNNIGLSNLQNLPFLPKLEILEIRENNLSGKDFNLIALKYPLLKKLKVGGNRIKEIDYFNALSKTDIISIELFNTSVYNKKGYRDELFHKIKSLESIDNVDRQGYHLDSDWFNADDDDEYDDDEEAEDGEFVANGEGEDEFDEDFDEEEEDFELSQYDSAEEKKNKENKPSNDKTNNANGNEKKEDVKESNKKTLKFTGKKKIDAPKNYHSDDNEVSITSSENPNRVKGKNNGDNIFIDLNNNIKKKELNIETIKSNKCKNLDDLLGSREKDQNEEDNNSTKANCEEDNQ